MNNTRNIIFVLSLFFLIFKSNAQEGFRVELNVGPALSDSRGLYSFALQGNLYYLLGVSENINMGFTTGAYVFLGDGSEYSGAFGSIPDVYIPLATAFRTNFTEKFIAGIDTGYGFNTASYGGFYLRPLIAYSLKKKVALVLGYSNINEDGYTASSISIGINFRF